MRHAPQPLLSVDEYLEGELTSEVRHEYVAGVAYAMVGTSRRHNRIAGNLLTHLRAAARGSPCQVFMSDLKVRVPTADAFYYPDIAVTCDPGDDQEYYLERPCLIVEVLSPHTEAIDRREKLQAYRTLPSLQAYLLVSQEVPQVEIYERGGNGAWTRAVLLGIANYQALLALAQLARMPELFGEAFAEHRRFQQDTNEGAIDLEELDAALEEGRGDLKQG